MNKSGMPVCVASLIWIGTTPAIAKLARLWQNLPNVQRLEL
jgi:hypothetical protein